MLMRGRAGVPEAPSSGKQAFVAKEHWNCS